MEARCTRAAFAAAALSMLGASHRTDNFIVSAPTPEFAQQVGQQAEQYRRELAVLWLGRELPRWAQPCPITLQVAPHLGAGGATSFVFDHGEVFRWQMTIQGSAERILDSVLPHEVTHTIFASHFRCPLPRWADEGACTTVEHASERGKQQRMLIEFLQTGRGIAFSRLFAMRDYPSDVMPLYSEGYSLCRFLIEQGGRRKFIEFLTEGMASEQWSAVLNKHYGKANLATLQDAWLAWVRIGSPALINPNQPGAQGATVLAANARRPRPEPNLIYRGQNADGPSDEVALATAGSAMARQAASGPAPRGATAGSGASVAQVAAGGDAAVGWYPRGSRKSQDGDVGAAADFSQVAGDGVPGDVRAGAMRNEVTRPQPVEPARQIILEWNRGDRSAAGPRGPASSASTRTTGPRGERAGARDSAALLDAGLGSRGTVLR